jgi:transketolase
MLNSKSLSVSIRRTILNLTYENKASHVGGAMSVADVLAVLYANILKYKTTAPQWEERDRLFYSKGHACTSLYAVLCLVGFYTEEELSTFTQNGSFFTSHVNNKVSGVELSTGSLGHALSVACGVALAGKRKKANWHTYCIVSDGELNEGSNWEAILFAPHHELDNLTLVVDYNKIQSFGTVKEVLDLAPLSEKFESFGWHVIEIDGHNHEEIASAFLKKADAPKVIIANTIKGKGVDFMEHQLAWHYKSPNKEQLEQALLQIEISS